MSGKESNFDYTGNIESDAIPFGAGNYFNEQADKLSDDQGFTFSTNNCATASPLKTSPNISLNIRNSYGGIHIGEVHNTTINRGRNITVQSNVINYDSSEDSSSSADSSCESESEPEPEIDERILSSTLKISLLNMEMVADNVGSKYPKMARHLKGANFNTVEIENIMRRNHYSEEEGIYQILEKWGQKAPEQATVGNLAEALQRIDRIDLANKLLSDEPKNLEDFASKLTLNEPAT